MRILFPVKFLALFLCLHAAHAGARPPADPVVLAGGDIAECDTSWGVLKRTPHPDSYDWEFLPAAGGQFRDAGSGRCVRG